MADEGLIIGLTGRFGAGCTETSKYFTTKPYNFTNFSISSFLKDKAKKEYRDFDKKEPNIKRVILQDLGDKLRKDDKSILVNPIIDKIKKDSIKNAVVECIRNTYEVEKFRKTFGDRFFLLAIDAEVETRWNRLKKLYKERKEFDENDERDAGYKQPKYGQNVKGCIELADILINSEENFYNEDGNKNDKVIDSYGQKLSDYSNLMMNPGVRPPYNDELYIQHACSVALRSECSSRQVGAVIVREIVSEVEIGGIKKKVPFESYVVATGCNNAPFGEDDCTTRYGKGEKDTKCHRKLIKERHFSRYKFCRECGAELKGNLVCSKCKVDNEKLPGKLLDLCRAVHAEAAAIIQAAKLGSSPLDNTILYSSTFPCMLCCKEIINTGIKRVVYLEAYPMDESLAVGMFKKCNVKIDKYEGVNPLAFNRIFKKIL
jgi:deoxycytidylate deaminase